MMGRGLERLASVPAGCCLAIGGLERAILKSATLASTPAARPLAPMLFQVGGLRAPPSA
jgi:ribosome assembly protein 1